MTLSETKDNLVEMMDRVIVDRMADDSAWEVAEVQRRTDPEIWVGKSCVRKNRCCG